MRGDDHKTPPGRRPPTRYVRYYGTTNLLHAGIRLWQMSVSRRRRQMLLRTGTAESPSPENQPMGPPAGSRNSTSKAAWPQPPTTSRVPWGDDRVGGWRGPDGVGDELRALLGCVGWMGGWIQHNQEASSHTHATFNGISQTDRQGGLSDGSCAHTRPLRAHTHTRTLLSPMTSPKTPTSKSRTQGTNQYMQIRDQGWCGAMAPGTAPDSIGIEARGCIVIVCIPGS
ncbi:hypothetical protein GGR56DRAFT_629221, partial [Xylariaceae sp. FL0804]